MAEEIDDGGWICPTCKGACAFDWSYCPYCGDFNPDEE